MNLFGGDQIGYGDLGPKSGSDMYLTLLDDAVDKQINSSGPPFVGSFRSTEPLSRLHGESIKGRWTLVANSVTSDTGSLSWKISANTNDSAPKSSIERGKVFTSSPYTHDYKGFKSNIISISDEDTLKNLQVEISLKNETSNAVLKETGFQLVSPNDKSVTLYGFNIGNKFESTDGSNLFRTIFTDESQLNVDQGKAPSLESLSPVRVFFFIRNEDKWRLEFGC